ncbi:hypothetical protein C1H46_043248 [Malus baccata]|uniref:Uncharacterized protein n=1 Tax=Malus baccata TaxID=106549 RepID=A0A540KAI3_MALBA|nr:hypothetical protein C1H46_043248 [Malus baccata]
MSLVPYPEVPTQLQECIKTDVLEGVDHTKSQQSSTPHGQLLKTLTYLNTGQTYTNEKFLVAELDRLTMQPIKLQKNLVEFYEQAEICKGRKKKLKGNQILCQEIQPVQNLWVLSTRLKSVRWRHNPP